MSALSKLHAWFTYSKMEARKEESGRQRRHLTTGLVTQHPRIKADDTSPVNEGSMPQLKIERMVFMKQLKKVVTVFMCAVMTATVMLPCASIENTPFSIVSTIKASAASGRLYNQNDSQWKNVKFTKYSKTENSMAESGCGIFSFCNAIYALNGTKADAKEVATWGVNNGSYLPGKGGLDKKRFYDNVQAAWGSKLGFTLAGQYGGKVTDSRLVNHLRGGGVAVAHVKGHFIAVTGYNGKYHVIESAVNKSFRGLDADSWVSASKLSSGNTNVDWYVLISKVEYFKCNLSGFISSSIVAALNKIGVDSSFAYRKKIAEANGISNYTGTGTQNTTMLLLLRAGKLIKPSTPVSASNTSYFKKYTGTSGSIVVALQAIGVDSSFNYRKKIAGANGISSYSGTAQQNTKLLSLLKNGQLKKP